MEKLLELILAELVHGVIISKVKRATKHYWVRLRSREGIQREIYEKSVRGLLESRDPVLMAIYSHEEVAARLLPLLRISDPDILEDSISSLVRKYPFRDELIRSLLEDYTRKLLLHPRASEFEDRIGILRDRPLHDILRCPEDWEKRVKERSPGDYLSYNYRKLGQSLARRGNWIKAKEFFSLAVQKSKNEKEKAKSLTELGTMLFDLGRYEEALPNLAESIRLAMDFEELEDIRLATEGLLAWIAMYRGYLTYAEEIFKRHESYHFLGRIYCETGRCQEALKMFDSDIARNERLRRYRADEDHYACIGFNSRWKSLTLVRLGENKQAEYWRDRSKGIFRDHYALAHLLRDEGWLAFQSGKIVLAIDQFERAIGIWQFQHYLKGYLENTLLLGKAWLQLKDYRRAVRALTTVVQKSKPMANNRFSTEADSLMDRIEAELGEKDFRRIMREIELVGEDRTFRL